MSPIYIHDGKLLIKDGALAADAACCCKCTNSTCSGIVCAISDIFNDIDCNRAGIHIHTVTIPNEYSLPVPINITGAVDDDLLIDGQSVSANYEPGSYIEPNTGCVQAHTIGDQPGPFKDPNGGITIPMNNRTFEVSLRDTLASVHAMNITICIDPNNTQNVCLPPIISGCCDSGLELYCYEKTISVPADPPYDCVTRICATGIPEGEDWTQISGPFDCGCIDCAVTGNCIAYTGWKIIDQNNYVYASGDITYINNNGLLNDLPNPFTPLFYGSVGEKNFKLQGYCSGGGEWHNLELWNGTIALCSSLSDRYPSQPLNGSWAPQGDCSKPVNENGDFVCDINGQFSSDCPSLVPGTLGDGQAWRDPDHTIAVTFTGAEDGEWTNLANWEDAAGRSPARYLPDANSVVEIAGAVTSIASDTFFTSVKEITILSTGSIGTLALETEKLTVYGSINNGGICDTESGDDYGYINVTGSAVDSCVFDGGNINYGKVTAPNTTVIFKNNSTITGDVGSISGDCLITTAPVISCSAAGIILESGSINSGYIQAQTSTGIVFKTGTTNNGTVEGNTTFEGTSNNSSTGIVFYGWAKFYGTANNSGWVLADGGDAEFYDDSTNSGRIGCTTYDYNNEVAKFYNTSHTTGTTSDIDGKTIFYDNSYSSGTGEFRWVEYYDTSYNTGTVRSDSNVFFNEDSYNEGTITGEQSNPAECSFFGNSINKSTGIVSSRNSLYIEGKNQGSITITEAGNYVYVRGSGMNDTTGTITANTIFENVGGNIPRNKGTITGIANFTSGGCNDGGTATTFIPDPPPVC